MDRDTMFWFLAGLGTGAALMYFLDPDRGVRRRSLVTDQVVGLTNDAQEAISNTAEDLSNRAYGLAAEAQKVVTGTPMDELSTGTSGTQTQSGDAQT